MPNFEIVPDGSNNSGFPGADLMREFIKTIKANPDAIRSSRNAGMALILLTQRLRYTQAAAYRLVYPERRCSDESAARHARAVMTHHRKKYPLSLNEALEVNGATIEGIVEDIQAERYATKFRWNSKTETWEETDIPDYPTRRAARKELREWVNMEQKSRQELTVGKAEMRTVQLNTGRKFETIQEWQEWMESQHEVTMAERRQAAIDMRLIAAGRQIIQEEGQKAADRYRQAARDADMTGEEPLPDDFAQPPNLSAD